MPIPCQAASYEGVARRDELLREGWSDGQLNAQVRGRRWRRLNDAVLVLHNGTLTLTERVLAVWLSAQSPAAICGLTAAARHGLHGHETDVVHVVVRHGGRVLPTPGIPRHVHESRRFGDEDIRLRHRPAYVGVERAVVDAAVWSRRPLDASRLFANSVQQRLTTPIALLEELERAGKVRHRLLLRRLLQDLHGGAQALSEVEFLRFCRRNDLPVPRLNVRFDGAGRRRYLDAEFIRRDGRPVHVEVDGGVHLNLTQRWRDTARDNDLVLAGRPVLRFPSVAIYADDPEAIAQIRHALGLPP